MGDEIDEVKERRLTNKALSALEQLADGWAEEIGIEAIAENLTKNKAQSRRLYSLLHHMLMEGAYRARVYTLDEKKAEIESLRVALREQNKSVKADS